MERCDFLPFRGGAAPAAEGVVIYRLPCRAALSVRKSLRAVRIAERNRYTGNTPLGSPSGTAGEWKRLFFWLQKSGVNCEKRKRFTLSPIQPLSLFAPSEQKSNSPCTGEPRFALRRRGAGLAQGSRETLRKPLGANFARGARGCCGYRLCGSAALGKKAFAEKMLPNY